MAKHEASPSEPLLLLIEIHLTEFIGGFREVDDAFNRRLELLHPLDPPIEIRFADEGPRIMVAKRSIDPADGRAIVEVWRE